jgi:group I intron endonuclease
MGIIYKIYNDEWCYIGSTLDLKKREREHKCRCNNEKCNEYNYQLYQTIRDNGGWDNFKMEIVQKFNYNITKVELRKKEQFYINLLNPNMNSCNAYISKEERLEQMKQYQEDNKEQIKENKKQYQQDNKEKAKQYQQANKEKTNEKQRERRLKKKQEAINLALNQQR